MLRFPDFQRWKEAFTVNENSDFIDERDSLKTEYLKFRNKVQTLVGKIAGVLPDLTIHDISHLDALWETADIIAGENYPLNPLEAFIFGGAVLLHDAAMCWEVYEQGQDGVRKTIEWRDAYAIECENNQQDDLESKSAADFSALRYLHAHQASNLISKSWKHPDTDESIFLIENIEIRTHLGRLIGEIASSHHWDINLLQSLGEQFNAPSGFPSSWHVDPIKIACLLRCADAAHFNQDRAPDFIYALVKRKGLSKHHWQAQNRIMGPSIDCGDKSRRTILYTSSIPFKEDESESWWVAYDAISLIDKEIYAVNKLLNDRNRSNAPKLHITNVKGAKSIEEIVKLFPVDGWFPCKAQMHISNVESLVKSLGGNNLYGPQQDKTTIVFRELIQNARDAIVSRQFVDDNFEGEIHFRYEKKDDESWVYIEDNGIGMSHDVMLGPLLDFGSSFWKSTLIQSEFPGLRSSRFRSIGRFGIGFYSVFMIADRVEVISRRWDKGLDDTNHLLFKTGLNLRPIYKTGRADGFSSNISTKIKLRLKPNILQDDLKVSVKPPFMGATELFSSLSDYLAAMLAGLDVKVSFSTQNSSKQEIHGGKVGINPNAETLLKQISFSKYKSSELGVASYISKNHQRLRLIKSNDKILGFAAISTTPHTSFDMLCTSTIGGLSSGINGHRDEHYIGFIDYKPASAKRDVGTVEAAPETIQEWAKEQIQILINDQVNDFEFYIACLNICEFDIDTMLYAKILVTKDRINKFSSYNELALIAKNEPITIMKMAHADYVEVYSIKPEMSDGVLVINSQIVQKNKSLSLKMNSEGTPENPFGIIGCLHRAVLADGRIPKWSTSVTPFSSQWGPVERLELRST